MRQRAGAKETDINIWTILIRLSVVIDVFNRRLGRFMIWPIFLAVIVSAGNAISRKFFDASSNAFLELQWYLFGFAFLGAAGYVLMVDEHVRIDAIAQRLRPRTKALIDLVLLVVFVLPMTGLFGILGYDFFLTGWVSEEVSSNAGSLVRWPAYAFIPFGMLCLGLQALSEIIRRAAWLYGHADRPNLSEADLPPFLPEPGGGK